MNTIAKPIFRMGKVVATPRALAALEEAREDPNSFLMRHEFGDWGERFLVVESLLLREPLRHQSGLVSIDTAICMALDFEHPLTANRMTANRKFGELVGPCTLQRLILRLYGS